MTETGRLYVYSRNRLPVGFDVREVRCGAILSFGEPPYGYFWDGGAVAFIGSRELHCLSHNDFLKPAQRVQVGPYTVRVVRRWVAADGYTVIRDSMIALLYVRLQQCKEWGIENILGRLYRWGYRHGLVTPSESIIASWRDVNAIDWLARKLGR